MTTLPFWFGSIGDEVSDGDTRRRPAVVRDTAPPTSQRAAFELPDDIVERVRARDDAALDLLLQVVFPPLVRFAYGFVRSMDAAEDVVQDVMVRIWSQGAEWAPRGSVTAYLYSAVRNRALNAVRDARGELRRAAQVGEAAAKGESALGIPVPDPSPEQRVVWGEFMTAFEQALDALTERQRTAVLLRYEQGRTVPDVAVVLEISTKAAEKLLARAIRELRERLEHVVR